MLVVCGILLYAVVLMTIVSKVFGDKLVPANARSGMIMELPPYHKPHWKHIFKKNRQGFSVIQLPRGIAPFLSINTNKCLQTCV